MNISPKHASTLVISQVIVEEVLKIAQFYVLRTMLVLLLNIGLIMEETTQSPPDIAFSKTAPIKVDVMDRSIIMICMLRRVRIKIMTFCG